MKADAPVTVVRLDLAVGQLVEQLGDGVVEDPVDQAGAFDLKDPVKVVDLIPFPAVKAVARRKVHVAGVLGDVGAVVGLLVDKSAEPFDVRCHFRRERVVNIIYFYFLFFNFIIQYELK